MIARSRFALLPVVLLLALGLPTAAQDLSLTTTYATNNGQDGNMFDIAANVDITITRVDVHFDAGDIRLQVHAIPGGYQGYEADPGAWTLLGEQRLVGHGAGIPTPADIPLNQTILAGETWGFYITNSGGAEPSIKYTNGTGVVYGNQDLTLYEGLGLAYPFGMTFSPRTWNGTIYYVLGTSGGGNGLSGSPATLSVQLGGTQNLSVAVGSSFAGQTFHVLGSLLGTQPGLTYGGINLPLNPDNYLLYTFFNPNSAYLPNSAGLLDSAGRANSGFALPPQSDASLIGLVLNHAAAVIDISSGVPVLTKATNAVPLTLVP